ncbi:XrtA system polysaccharide chain length determinant [Massilia sp. CF038]|uniref:XrtA system polysaccharide chain length determinant n=1 Tax=Massilia sp. CF038 TaxID=1881045 RepID=UPI0009146619|nr:XrtA system polysaccharide chain length determinant [Massilia sp. CF038]SHG74954.1 polysaccharide chain length determinant protein, PEP-CTERM locus subfamily [Massilia sp. CF038]
MEELISQLQVHARRFWKYRWYAMGVMWLCALAGWATVLTMPSDYQASARVYVDTQSILKPLLSGMTTVPNVEQQVSIMSRTLLSRPNLERVMRMVDLDLQSNSARQRERALDQLAATIKITGTSSHDIYTISYRGGEPKQARDVVQSLLTIFVEGSFTGKRDDSRQAVRFIDDQIRGYETRLISAENALKDFKVRYTGLLPRQGDYSAQLADAADALNTARLEMDEAEQARNAIRAQMGGEPPRKGKDRRPVRINNPELDARIALVAKDLDALRLQYTEQHPDIVAAKRLIGQLEARKIEESKHPYRDNDPGRNYSPMLQQLKVAQTEADAKLAAIRVRVAEFGARHARLLEQSKAVPEVEAQLSQLNRDYQINKDNYEKLISKREAAKLSGELSSTTEMMTFKIIDPPTLPLTPVGPDRPLLTTLTLCGALCAGMLTAVLIGQARPTFASPAALRELTGLPVLGTVSLTWTEAERARRRHSRLVLASAFGALVFAYGAVLAASVLRT